MQNPILNKLNQSNNLLNNISNIKQLLSGKNPDEVLVQMLQTNPQFKEFYDLNKNKSVEEIATAYGLDVNAIKNLL